MMINKVSKRKRAKKTSHKPSGRVERRGRKQYNRPAIIREIRKIAGLEKETQAYFSKQDLATLLNYLTLLRSQGPGALLQNKGLSAHAANDPK